MLKRRDASLASRRALDAWRAMGHDVHSVVALPPCAEWHALRKLAAAGFTGPSRQAAAREDKARNLARHVARAALAAVAGVLSQAMFFEDMEPAVVDEL